VSGAAADWLAGRRGELNQRFVRARRRFPKLAPDAVLALLADVLPPLAGPEAGSAELLSSVFDLVLLHVGRDALATSTGLALLLRDVFPRARALLLARPASLPAQLSNAVENLGARGGELARALGRIAGRVARPEELLDAGALAAWRLGEARLRDAALAAGARLPPRAVLAALELDDWPPEAAALVVAALVEDAWLRPEVRFADATLAGLVGAAPERVAAIAGRLRGRGGELVSEPSLINSAAAGELVSEPSLINSAAPDPSAWPVVAQVGDFAGFGGPFRAPPLLVDGSTRHRLIARVGDEELRLDADVYGWVCRPSPPTGRPTTSRLLVDRALATTDRDSHRIRVHAPRRERI
jgi:hypothetical protein